MLGLAGCATAPDQTSLTASPATGPKIVAETAADWTALNPVVSISIPVTSVKDADAATVKLDIFPRQKYITFEAMPVWNGSTACVERGEHYQPKFIASPGAAVSENVGGCEGRNITRYRGTVSYSTHSNFANGTLKIDGKAQLHFDDIDNIDGSLESRRDYDVEVHGALQIAGATCRVQAWRHTIHQRRDDLDGAPTQENMELQSTPGAACSVVLAK